MKPKNEDRVRATMRTAGFSEAAITDFLAEEKRVAQCLKRLECPYCHKSIIRELDPRQAGDHALPGLWHQYRCPWCAYAIDCVELPTQAAAHA